MVTVAAGHVGTEFGWHVPIAMMMRRNLNPKFAKRVARLMLSVVALEV